MLINALSKIYGLSAFIIMANQGKSLNFLGELSEDFGAFLSEISLIRFISLANLWAKPTTSSQVAG
jgi:hypothetical protein